MTDKELAALCAEIFADDGLAFIEPPEDAELFELEDIPLTIAPSDVLCVVTAQAEV